MYAYVDYAGAIGDIVVKPNPIRFLQIGERILPYPVPNVDLDLYTVTPVTPVPADATAVAFLVVEKPGADALREARFLRQIDSDADDIYKAVIGNRGTEYAEAELQAQAYKDAGYSGTVQPYIASWSAASGMTATQAADDILAQAAAWRGAAETVRAYRLAAKAKVRLHNFTVAMNEWNTFVSYIRAVLGVST